MIYYACKDCQRTFEQPKRVKDYDSMDYYISVCPHCGSDSYSHCDDENDEPESEL